MESEQTNQVCARGKDDPGDSGQKGFEHQFQHNWGGGDRGKNGEENKDYTEARYKRSKHIWKSSDMVTVCSYVFPSRSTTPSQSEIFSVIVEI